MKRLLMAALLVASASAASAAGQGNGYGLGMDSCAVFAQKYGANPDVAESLYFTWAQGFMSALNLEASANGKVYRIINGNDMSNQKMLIRSYCNEHPLTQYVAAVLDLYERFPPGQ
jgi:hypothetical protein